ncbi:MAG: hypothetical protein AAB353_03645 [Candidatus Hydrogenedentota bacterium]
MIPPFDDSGVLPPGIHPATLSEIKSRFGRESELRRVQMESIRWMVDLGMHAGVHRIVLNGSVVTDIMEPNDVDCVLLFIAGRRRNHAAIRELRSGLPFLDIAISDQKEFDRLTGDFFAEDRLGSPKGMVEVVL